MDAPVLHSLEERFLRLSVVKKMITSEQVQRCLDILKERLVQGEKNLGIEQVLQEEGLLTDDESEFIWEIIASTGDVQVKQQVAERKGTEPGISVEEIEKATSSTFKPSKEVPEQIAGYKVLNWIGRGGMGAVYRAHQLTMDREVALKLLTPELASNAKFIRRFIREARAAGRLNHAHLVRVYDVGESEGRYYISMEYIEGRTVKQVMRREGRISVPESLRITEQVAEALDHAHHFKIIHRDIKPDNIMLDDRDETKLCDLGLAKELEAGPLQDTDTQEGQTMGTPHYMSPEQARAAGEVDQRSDIYSLGATLYHMVTGQVPFDGETPIEVLMKVTSEPTPRPDRIDPLLPPPLTRLILRMLAKNPAERPQTAMEVVREARRLRKDLEDGRVFVFEERPNPLKGRPVPAPSGRHHRKQNYWKIGILAACLFLVLSVFVRDKKTSALPPMPVPHFEATIPEETEIPSVDLEPPEDLNSTQPAIKNSSTPKPHPTDQKLEPIIRILEQRIRANPQDWPRVLADLDTAEPRLKKAPAELRKRFMLLKQKILLIRDKTFQDQLRQYQQGAEALAKAGYFKQAAELIENALSRTDGTPEREKQILKRSSAMRIAGRRDARIQAETLEGLARSGLLELATARWNSWIRELKADHVNDNSERTGVAEEARKKIMGIREKIMEQRRNRHQALKSIQENIKRIREFSKIHRWSEAREECTRLRRLAVSDEERAMYDAERERIDMVRAFMLKIGEGIASNQKRIKTQDFLSDSSTKGTVMGVDESFIHLSIRGGTLKIPLYRISRNSMRLLFDKVILNEKLMAEDLVARMAYDLGDPKRTFSRMARIKLVALAKRHPLARALLKNIGFFEDEVARVLCSRFLTQAEELLLMDRPTLSARTVATALSALAGRETPTLQKRAQHLLEQCADGRTAHSFSAGTFHVLRRNRGRLTLSAEDMSRLDNADFWTGPSPELRPEGGLTFKASSTKANLPQTQAGPTLLSVTFQVPTKQDCTLALVAEGLAKNNSKGHEVWSLIAEQIAGKLWVTLHSPTSAPQEQKRIHIVSNGKLIRLWLRIHVGYISWGQDNQTFTTQATSPTPSWRTALLAKGSLILHQVSIEGKLHSGSKITPTLEIITAEFLKAIQAKGKIQKQAINQFLKTHGRHPQWATKAYLALADIARSEGRLDMYRFFECRAFFECPESMWPKGTALRAQQYLKEFQQIHAQFGLFAPDPRDAQRFDSFKLPKSSF